jgi:hypothetical protein
MHVFPLISLLSIQISEAFTSGSYALSGEKKLNATPSINIDHVPPTLMAKVHMAFGIV